MDNETLATELLKEVKASAKRWFIAFCIMIGLELATIIGFMWYISLPIEEVTTSYEQDADDDSRNLIIGGDYNGETESNQETQEKSNEK